MVPGTVPGTKKESLIMIKTIGYLIFASIYYISCLFPLNDKRVLCIMTHDDGEDGNVSLLVSELKRLKRGYNFSYITKSETESVKSLKDVRKLLSFFFIKPYHMARSKIILMDNVFLPMAYIRIKGNVKVIQLWHGTGTIKKFGQDVNSGRLKVLEKRANRNITHLIVNNKQTAKLYAKVFGVDLDRVYPVGLPKTDDIFNRMQRINRDKTNAEKNIIYEKYNLPMEKKLILYAPTFRDMNLGSDAVLKHVEEMARKLPMNYILGLRLHPYVARMAQKLHIDNVCDLSGERSLSLLMMASDLLITDYSSIIFEFCITKKPMIFFAYDLDDFTSSGRGFYNDYVSYVPGPIARNSKEVIDIINEEEFSLDMIQSFNRDNFPNLDGKATERIIELISNK
ncbi:MAG: hypothetical protein EWM47_04675 [Anaerolineaceae bacterium]|nr:MAG: hypothetical protein EWM47_04675 [Anaerolineaceae bacterium]